jgi:hypothetical protein
MAKTTKAATNKATECRNVTAGPRPESSTATKMQQEHEPVLRAVNPITARTNRVVN